MASPDHFAHVEVDFDGVGYVRVLEDVIPTRDWFGVIMALSKSNTAAQEAVCMVGAARMASHQFEYYRTNLPR